MDLFSPAWIKWHHLVESFHLLVHYSSHRLISPTLQIVGFHLLFRSLNHFPCWHQKSFHLLLRSFHLFGSIDFTYSFGSLIPTRIKVVSPTLQIVSPTLRIVDSCLDQWFHLLLRSFHLLFGSSIPAWIKVVSPTPRIVSPTLRIVDSCLDQKWYHLLCGSMDFTYSSDRRLPLGSVVSPTLRIFVFHLLFRSLNHFTCWQSSRFTYSSDRFTYSSDLGFISQSHYSDGRQGLITKRPIVRERSSEL